MKTFEGWFWDTYQCTEAGFRERARLYGSENVDEVLQHIHKRYQKELDREYLDQMDLTFPEWLEGYHGLTPQSFHELCVATGSPPKEEQQAYEWFERRYMQEQQEKELIRKNPFIDTN